jgi:hypothetical protein
LHQIDGSGARWLAFRSHYGFDAFYCQPGVGGAHEKGGVEGEGGRFRRNHCVPMPVVDSISELNDLIAAADAIDDHRRIANRATTVGRDYLIEKPRLRPLPTAEFPTWLTLEREWIATPGSQFGSVSTRCRRS